MSFTSAFFNSIRKLIVAGGLFVYVAICHCACSSLRYAPGNGHSHNDYLNAKPFYNGYKEGFGSIEADIFPVNGVLYVAHHKEEIQKQNTLKAVYLDPLLQTLLLDSLRKLNLLVDIKEDYRSSLSLLVQELQPLIPFLTTPSKARNITISISGERPPPNEYIHYPDYIFFDDDLKLKHTPEQWQRVRLVSLPFPKFSKWTGFGSIPSDDVKALKHTIDSVHSAGKPIRFWAAPDTEAAWRQQMKLGVDLIGTDKINELATYLRKGRDRR